MFKNSPVNSLNSKLNGFYIGFIVLWPVLQYFIGFDGKGRIPFFGTLAFLAYSFFANQKQFLSMPLLIWWIWVAYALINTFFIQGTPMPPADIIGFCTGLVSGPLIAKCIIDGAFTGRDSLLKYIGYVILLYLLGTLMIPSTNEYEGHGISAFGNIVPITIVFMVFVFAIRFIHKDISLKLFVVVSVLAVFLVVVSATRKAFGGLFIVLLFTYLSKMQKFSFKTFFVSVLVGLILYALSDTFISSDLWERFYRTNEQSAVGDYDDNLFLSLMDDRAIMYVTGWDVFLDNLWLGIGLRNYLNLGYSAYTLHTEYMVQLTECGIVGSSLFLWFYLKMAKGLIRKAKWHSYEALVYLGGYVTIIFMSFTTWTYNQPVFWICIGLILAYIKKQKYENCYCRS